MSGGALQHAEQQEAETRKTQRTQHHHLVTALRVLLWILKTHNHNKLEGLFKNYLKLRVSLWSFLNEQFIDPICKPLPVCCQPSILHRQTAAHCRFFLSRLQSERPGDRTRRRKTTGRHKMTNEVDLNPESRAFSWMSIFTLIKEGVCTWYSFSLISLATLSVNLASGTGAGFWGAELLWLNQSVNASWASCEMMRRSRSDQPYRSINIKSTS